MASKGIFHAYGLFWRRDEIVWSPGAGRSGEFALLGRRGKLAPSLKIANFRYQPGIYILYGDYGPHYVGLTREMGLGHRLKDHCYDIHKNKWDRFSFFSFGRVLKRRDSDGCQCFADVPVNQSMTQNKVIGDIEAILIRAMALQNSAKMKFAEAEQWHQVKLDEVDLYYERSGCH